MHTVVKPPYSMAMSTQRSTPKICATIPGCPVLISGVPSSPTTGGVPRKSTLSIGVKFTVAQAAVSVDSVLRSGDAVNWLYVRTTATAVYRMKYWIVRLMMHLIVVETGGTARSTFTSSYCAPVSLPFFRRSCCFSCRGDPGWYPSPGNLSWTTGSCDVLSSSPDLEDSKATAPTKRTLSIIIAGQETLALSSCEAALRP